MTGSILDTNVITRMLDKDPAAINLVKKVENAYTSVIGVVQKLQFLNNNH
jgi:predicted nucleic acid-binding protein